MGRTIPAGRLWRAGMITLYGLFCLQLNGCTLTKAATVPMRPGADDGTLAGIIR